MGLPWARHGLFKMLPLVCILPSLVLYGIRIVGFHARKGPLRALTPELVLYGIRLLAKQFLGTVLDMEVDQSGSSERFL